MNWSQLVEFQRLCEAAGLETPEPITRGLHLRSVARSHAAAPRPVLLKLNDAGVRKHVEAIAIRFHDGNGIGSRRGMAPGIDEFETDLAVEVRDASMPHLEQLVEELRPRFDELAAPLVTAARDFGFTYATTSDEVIEMADEAASAAWRGVPRAWKALAPIVSLRLAISKTFDVSPNMNERRAYAFPNAPGATEPNYSVCFAAGDNWSFDDGYYIEGKTVGHLDWLALARDGLRLNSPQEVRAKLDGRGIGSLPPQGMPTDSLASLGPIYR